MIFCEKFAENALPNLHAVFNVFIVKKAVVVSDCIKLQGTTVVLKI